MAREVFNTPWIKLEVIGDDYTLQPDTLNLVQAAEKLVRDGLLTEDRLWRALTVNPARIAGISAGTLATGGGVIIVDPEAGWNIAPETLVSAGHNTPFVGMLVQGRVQAVLL